MKKEVYNINNMDIKSLSEYCKMYARRIVITHSPSGVYINGVMRE